MKDNIGPARRRASAISGVARAKHPCKITNEDFQQERPCKQPIVMTVLHLIGRYCGFLLLAKLDASDNYGSSKGARRRPYQ
jgi:hypothetical protein